MKKLFSLLVAIVMASSLFATDYYLTVKSNNTAEGEVSWSESSGFGATAARTKVGTSYTSTKSFYVKAKAGKQFAYAKSSYSTNTWYINSSTTTMWSGSPTWRSGSGTQMFTVKLSNLGYTSTSSKADGTFTIYFKDLNVLTFKNEDGTTLKTYQLRDNEATPSTSDLFSIRPTKAEDANYTYSFKGWFNGNTEYSGGYGKYITSNQTYTAVFTATPKATKYTVSINTPSNGTLQVKNGNNILSSGAQVDENTTLTIVTTNSTAHYHCSSVSVLNGSTPVSVSNNQFTLTSDVTVSATFEEDAKYTVNITTPENGTISVMNGSTPVNDGDKVYTGTVLTVTANPAEHYHFGAWTNNGAASVTVNSDVTIGATFELNVYTIRFYANNNTLVREPDVVGYGNTINLPSDLDPINNDDETCMFAGWYEKDGNGDFTTTAATSTVTKSVDYYAKFECSAVTKYNITLGNYTNGTVTVAYTVNNNLVTKPIAAGASEAIAEGYNVTITATQERGYHLTGWTIGETDADIVELGNSIRVSMYDDVTVTPNFAENVGYDLEQTFTEEQCTSGSAYNKTNVLTVTLKDRTFTVGEWSTLSVPFDYTLTDQDDLYGGVYKFSKVLLATENSVSLEFVRTYNIVANEPYMIIPRKNVTEPKFYGVEMVNGAEVTRTTDNQVEFVSALWQQTLHGPNDFYVGAGSTLRYARTLGTTLYGNRAFFRKINGAASSVPRRVTIVLDGVEVEKEIAEDGSLEDVQNVRKYMENGRLVIECNGVRMDATGAKLN